MTTSVQLLVNGVDRTQYLEQTTWTITQQWSRQGDTAVFYLWDEHPSSTEGGTSLTYTIPPMATVAFTDTGLGQVLFSGLCTAPLMTRPGPNLTCWELQCTDWTYLADRALVQVDLTNITADAAVLAIVAQANCGINAASSSSGGYVYPGPLIARAKFIYTTLASGLTNIVQLASQFTSWGWYIDESRSLHFYPQASAPSSGVTLTDALTAAQHTSSTSLAFYQDDSSAYQYLWDATNLHNYAVVRGSSYFVSTTDTFVGNGSQSAWPLTQAPDTTSISGITLKVAGVTQTVSAQAGTSQGTQYIIQPNLSGQWFLQVNTGFGTVPGNGDTIVIKYRFSAPIIAVVTEPSSISQFSSLPNHGVFKTYIADSNLLTLATAQARGQSEVWTYGEPQERVTLITTEDFPGHIRAGQTFRLVSSFTPDSQRSYAVGINDLFMAVQCTIAGAPAGGGYRTYQLTGARITTTGGV